MHYLVHGDYKQQHKVLHSEEVTDSAMVQEVKHVTMVLLIKLTEQ